MALDAKDNRQKNIRWAVQVNESKRVEWHDAHLAVLMDLRDELQTLNRLLGCPNFTCIPRVLDEIAKNTTKRKYNRKKVQA